MKKTCLLFSLLTVFCILLSACGTQEEPAATSIPLPSETPENHSVEVTEAPTETPVEIFSIPTLAPGQKMTVLFDDDGSLDGTVALYYLLSHPQVNIIAIAITYGEAYPDIYIQHIGRQLDAFGIQDIPLGYGQSAPLEGGNDFPEFMRDFSNEFWGFPIPNPEKTYLAQPAPEMYVEIIHQSDEPVNIFISGPCTNLAQALQLDPSIREKIAAVYIMGGAVYALGNISGLLPDTGNITAEWNIYADPLAASEVFNSGLDIYLVPLDATDQVPISKVDTGQWREGDQAADLSADIYEQRMDSWNVESLIIWDLITAVVMVHPDLCEFQPMPLEVVTEDGNNAGQTALADGKSSNVKVCLKPEAQRIRQNLVEIFSQEIQHQNSSITPTASVMPDDSKEAALIAEPEKQLFFDGFDEGLLPGWTWENEAPSRWSLTGDGWLHILGEDASVLYGQAQSNLLWRDLPEGDFSITVHLEATPSVNFQQAAIYIYEDPENYVAINRGFCSVCPPGGNGIFMEYKIAGAWGAYSVAYPEDEVYLRLESQDNTISGYYAADLADWQRLGRFGNYYIFKRVGLGVSNCDNESDDSEELVGRFDYFEISRP